MTSLSSSEVMSLLLASILVTVHRDRGSTPDSVTLMGSAGRMMIVGRGRPLAAAMASGVGSTVV